MLLNHHSIYYSFADEPIFFGCDAIRCNFPKPEKVSAHLHRESNRYTVNSMRERESVSMCCKSSELFMHLKVFKRSNMNAQEVYNTKNVLHSCLHKT